jgi:hypothetical protein
MSETRSFENKPLVPRLVIAISFVLVLIVLGAAIMIDSAQDRNSSIVATTTSSSGSQGMQGILTGYVTVGPSQPVCLSNESCTVDMTGYSLEFVSQCTNSSSTMTSPICETQTYYAQLSPAGHYAILLTQGTYEMTTLLPSCSWMGCSSTFPMLVEVVGGQQIVVNVNIDTGIK